MTVLLSNPIAVDSDEFPVLTLAERDRHWALVRGLMADQGLDGLVVFGGGRNNPDAYLTGEAARATVVMTPTEDPLMILGDVPLNRYDAPGARFERWVDNWVHGNPVARLGEALRERGLASARVGVVGLTSRAVGQWSGTISHTTWGRVTAELPDVEWVDVADPYETFAIYFSEAEQQLVRKAAAIGEAACEAYVAAVGVGVPESVPTAAALQAIVAGGGWFRAPYILERAGASRFAWGHPEWFDMGGGPAKLAAGDSIASEVFAFYGGYESQQQIDVVLGKPDALLLELEEICLESYTAGMEALRPGMMFSELAAIMDAPLAKHGVWNTGPMVQTVPPIYNSATRLNPGVDPALAHLPALPSGVGLDGDFEIREGVAFAMEPNALRDGKRVCIGGTVLLSANGVEELNTIANRLQVVSA